MLAGVWGCLLICLWSRKQGRMNICFQPASFHLLFHLVQNHRSFVMSSISRAGLLFSVNFHQHHGRHTQKCASQMPNQNQSSPLSTFFLFLSPLDLPPFFLCLPTYPSSLMKWEPKSGLRKKARSELLRAWQRHLLKRAMSISCVLPFSLQQFPKLLFPSGLTGL